MFRDCEAMSEESFRTYVAETTESNLRSALNDADFDQIIANSWREVDGKRRYEKIVNSYIEEKLSNRSDLIDYARVFLSGYIPDRAEEMAEEVTDEIFSSPEFETLTDDVAAHAARQIASLPSIILSNQANQLQIAECLRAFLSTRYTDTIADFIQASIPEFNPGELELGASLDVTINIAQILVGIFLVLGRRIVARIVARIFRRIASALALRIVSAISVIGGVALLIADLVAGGDGPYPTIREELLSDTTERAIIASIAETLSEDAMERIPQEAARAAGQLHRLFVEFKQQNQLLLAMTEENGGFRSMVSELGSLSDVDALSKMVAVIQRNGGKDGVIRAFDRGQLAAYLHLPPSARSIAQELGSIEAAIEWADKSGTRIDRAYEAELHRQLDASQVTAEQLGRLLSIQNLSALQQIGSLSHEHIVSLLVLSRSSLSQLAQGRPIKELETMALLIERLDTVQARTAAARIVEREERTPSTFLRNESLIAGIVESRDQVAALEMAQSGLPHVLGDIELVVAGDVGAIVFWHTHRVVSIIALAMSAVLVLLLFRFLVFLLPRRARPSQGRDDA